VTNPRGGSAQRATSGWAAAPGDVVDAHSINGSEEGKRKTVAKFIQICASRDDLFALDEEGNIYKHNFSAQTWVQLIASRSHEKRA
jgi:hypothetical protein